MVECVSSIQCVKVFNRYILLRKGLPFEGYHQLIECFEFQPILDKYIDYLSL